MKAAVTAVVLLLLAGCSASPPPVVTVTASPPTPSPEERFLAAMHEAAVPMPDAQMVKTARNNCQVMDGTAKNGTAAQVALLQVGTGFTKTQAELFAREGQKAFCPDKLGK